MVWHEREDTSIFIGCCGDLRAGGGDWHVGHFQLRGRVFVGEFDFDWIFSDDRGRDDGLYEDR